MAATSAMLSKLFKDHGIYIPVTKIRIHRGTLAEECSAFSSELNVRAGLVGAFSYFGKRCEIVNTRSVGRYCSFGQDILVGAGPHPIDWLTSSSFAFRKPAYHEHESVSDFFDGRDIPPAPVGKPVTIGNDVWCGSHAVILTSVNVGHGAIIAANATVTKDVPPYAVVGGTPARVIRYRMTEPVIERVLTSEWWRVKPNLLKTVDLTNPDKAIDQIEEIKTTINDWEFAPKVIDISDYSNPF